MPSLYMAPSQGTRGCTWMGGVSTAFRHSLVCQPAQPPTVPTKPCPVSPDSHLTCFRLPVGDWLLPGTGSRLAPVCWQEQRRRHS